MYKNGLNNFSWDSVETVLLDMDGTLLDKHFDDYFWVNLIPEEYARKYNLEIDAARHDLLTRYKQEEKKLKEGKLNWTDLDYWSKELGIDIPALKEQVHHLITVLPHVENFLQFLQMEDKRIHLVTNAHYKTLELKLKKTEIGKYFDSVICAFDIGLPKEDNAFWGKLEELVGFHRETTMMIDDNENVLVSARNYGIQYLVFNARPSSRAEIKASEQFHSISYFEELILKE